MQMNLQTIGGVIALGLLSWLVVTTQELQIQLAGFQADTLNRIERLEFWTERLANRINKLETSE